MDVDQYIATLAAFFGGGGLIGGIGTVVVSRQSAAKLKAETAQIQADTGLESNKVKLDIEESLWARVQTVLDKQNAKIDKQAHLIEELEIAVRDRDRRIAVLEATVAEMREGIRERDRLIELLQEDDILE